MATAGIMPVAESFFSSLKKERIKKRIYTTREIARAEIDDYIEMSTIALVDTAISAGSVRRRLKPCQTRLNDVSTKVWEVHEQQCHDSSCSSSYHFSR